MKIVVTGGAGFIGSHLSERLLRLGHEICIIDELNDYYSPDLKRRNLEIVRAAGPIRFEQADISCSEQITPIFEGFRPDAVIHLAARAGVRPSLEQPLLYEQANVRGTMVLLEASRRLGLSRFIFASSSSIYGLANRVPFSEEDQVNLPISPYAATKIAGEKLAFTYSHLYGISIVCLRFFTVYGPRQRPDLAIRKFIDLISRGESIPVFGDGSTGRDYTYVNDTVAGILAALDYQTPYEIFNLGNSHPIRLTEMIETIEACLGKKARIEWLPDQPGDVPITYADITKARKHLGYNPETTFRQGVQQVVDWYLGPK
jgi:UDP-glucuronate 4-epimerase